MQEYCFGKHRFYYYFVQLFCVIFLCLLNCSLNAPRENPLDPHGLPYFINCKVTTHCYEVVEVQPELPDPESCAFYAIVGDISEDVDIESVWIEIPALSYTKRLPYDSDIQEYFQKLGGRELPGEGLEVLTGRDIFFNITTEDSKIVQSSPYRISRIIHDLPEVIFPKKGDTVFTNLTFIWHKHNHGYYVRYHGDIYLIVVIDTPFIYTKPFDSFDIDKQNDTTYNFDPSMLGSGYYYWTLAVIDSFGNSARCKEQVFYKD